MESLNIDRDKFLSLFPNHILVGGRLKENFVKGEKRIRHNISMTQAEKLNTLGGGKRDIFFSPNGDYKLYFGDNEPNDQKGRSLKTIKSIGGNIYALVADNDLGEKIWEEVGIKPTVVVKTKNGYHMYFVLKNPVNFSEYETKFKAVEDKFVHLLHADPQARDASRILRVPGFKYWADNEGEVDIEVVEYNEEEIHTFSERERRIDVLYKEACADEIDKADLKKRYKKTKGSSVMLDNIFDAIKQNVRAIEVLEDLFPEFYADGKGAISEAGKRTRGYKENVVGNYINNFSNDDEEQRPRGGPWHVAKIAHRNNTARILDYFAERWGIKTEDFRQSAGTSQEIKFQDFKQTTTEINSGQKKRPTYGNSAEGIEIFEDEVAIKGYQGELYEIPFLKGLIIPMGVYEHDNKEKYVIKIKRKDDTTGEIVEYISVLPKCGTVSELRKYLQGYGLMVPDKTVFFTFLIDYIFSNRTKYRYTNKLGLQQIDGEEFLITSSGTYIDEKRKLYVDIKDINIDEIRFGKEDVDIKKYFKDLAEGYEPKISVTMALNMMLAVNSYYFRNCQTQRLNMPQGFILGLSQSGKTTLLSHIFRSFGIMQDYSAASKAFIYEKSARHYLPIHFSEYRNSAHMQSGQIEGLMRNLADGTPIMKGRADQSTVTYESNAVYMMDGQTIFVDDAVRTRMIILLANDKHKGDEKKLIGLENVYKFATSIFKGQKDFEDFVNKSFDRVKELRERLPLSRADTRSLKSYSMLIELAHRLGVSKYVKDIEQALLEHDGMIAHDDIQVTYQKMFNLAVVNKFDTYLHKGGLVITAVEDGIRINGNIDDLKGMVSTVNNNFLGINELPNLSTYVDLEYIYNSSSLHSTFLRMLNFTNLTFPDKLTEQEKKTMASLREFLKVKNPSHDLVSEINFEEAYLKTKEKEGAKKET